MDFYDTIPTSAAQNETVINTQVTNHNMLPNYQLRLGAKLKPHLLFILKNGRAQYKKHGIDKLCLKQFFKFDVPQPYIYFTNLKLLLTQIHSILDDPQVFESEDDLRQLFPGHQLHYIDKKEDIPPAERLCKLSFLLVIAL